MPLTCKYVRSGYSSYLLSSSLEVTIKSKIMLHMIELGFFRTEAFVTLGFSSGGHLQQGKKDSLSLFFFLGFLLCNILWYMYLCLNILSPNNLVFDIVNPAVNLCWICVAVCVWQQSIKSWTQDCDLTAKSSGREAKLWKGTVLTRHKSSTVLAEELNSIGQVHWFSYKYSLFQTCDDREIFLHLTSLLVPLFLWGVSDTQARKTMLFI